MPRKTTATVPTTTPAEPVRGVLEFHDPNAVVIDVNVRTDADLEPEFLDSIAKLGVLEPVTALRLADGTISIRDGQLRTLAARKVKERTLRLAAEGDYGRAQDTLSVTQGGTEQAFHQHLPAPGTQLRGSARAAAWRPCPAPSGRAPAAARRAWT